ncbi:MAG: type I DNA topoisomerase [Tissierellia bacterium]|nr:type I DNA topoisomerase [Tissierellia bacterium]
MKTLVIVESPTKATTIKKMLNRNSKVIASVGHVRDLPKSTLGVDVDDNFEPKYINIRGKGKIINELKKEAKNADKVLLATDPDREGEAISWHLAHILGLKEDAPLRVEFNEITKDAITKAMKSPRPINKDVVDAQQGRRILDRLVGYKIGPIIWRKIQGGLSAGRVQSVAVKMICDREKEIGKFVPQEYWSLKALFKDNSYEFYADFIGEIQENVKVKKIVPSNEEEFNGVIDELKLSEYLVSKNEKKKKIRNPNPPFITSTLQQEASKKLGFKTKKTMEIAQSLYEGIDLGKEGAVGLITYMRTDSTRISDEAIESTRVFIEDSYGKKYSHPNRIYSKKKNVQDAHECIRPTAALRSPDKMKTYLSADQYKLYNLIWTRFVASQMASAQFEMHSIDINNGPYVFRATGQKLIFDGFLKIAKEKSEKENKLPDHNIGDKLKLAKLEKEQHFTQPPARYTESSLVKTMEELGIGRPSTYAATITTILARRYVKLVSKSFHPTELGITVNEMLVEFFPTIVDEKFTADMENKLDEVEEGDISWKNVISDFYGPFSEQLTKADELIPVVEVEEEISDEKCPKCGKNMVVKRGRFGKFLACPGYPECKTTKSISEEVISTGVKCPKCGKGELISRKSKRGKVFYGCNTYPNCDFALWDEPTGEKCPVCGKLLVKKVYKAGEKIICSDKECSFKGK